MRKADKPLVEAIIQSLDDNDRAVEKAFLIVGRQQTPEELANKATLEHNGVGFTGPDANFGTWAYDVISKGGHLYGNGLKTGRKMIKKYAKTQLLAAAKRRSEAKTKANAYINAKQGE